MTTYGVTAASGPLGHLTVEALLDRGVAAADIVAIARTTAKVADLAGRGVTVRQADYDAPDTLAAALSGVDVLLLVSGNEMGKRIAQHTAVVESAKAAGVTRIAYSSIVKADSSKIGLAAEHLATEQVIEASGLAWTHLRNSWYVENYTAQLAGFLERGAIYDATDGGRVSMAARADYAAAAATVLATEGHEGVRYELGGPAITLKDLAEIITEVTGTPVTEHGVTAAQLTESLIGAGLPADTAAFVAGLDTATARGELETDSAPLARLVGRPLTPVADVVRAAQAAL